MREKKGYKCCTPLVSKAVVGCVRAYREVTFLYYENKIRTISNHTHIYSFQALMRLNQTTLTSASLTSTTSSRSTVVTSATASFAASVDSIATSLTRYFYMYIIQFEHIHTRINSSYTHIACTNDLFEFHCAHFRKR